jgi:riboflavin kinase / FMN adenylyltransferase
MERISRGRRLGWPAPAVAVGNFDGVHRGHQALAAASVAEARTLSGTAAVLTFEPHPSRVLFPERAASTLMTTAQKAEVLAAHGIERVAVLEFTRELAGLTAEEFAREVLLDTLGARSVVVGHDFRFGRGRGGDARELAALGARLGFAVRIVEPVLEGGEPVSSTRIREAIEAGGVEKAAELLGRPYFVDGRVVEGDRRGRTLGFPTANLDLENETVPAHGVYAGWCGAADRSDPPRPAVVNIGRRPTFDGERTTVEAHLLGFEGDLYGRKLRLSFVERLRPERRFPGPDALRQQIEADVARAAAVLRAPTRQW